MEELKERLIAFKKKYYLKQLAVGSALFFIITLSSFLFLNVIEYQFWLGTSLRGALFFGFIALVLVLLYITIINPLLKWSALKKGINDQEASQEISRELKELDDQLINTLQLSDLFEKEQNDLLTAAIEKKVRDLRVFNFKSAINFQKAKKFSLVVLLLIGCLFLVSFINPAIISSSSERIINYNKEYVPEAPFQFEITSSLKSYKGEDYKLSFKLNGDNIPEKAFIVIDDILKREVSRSTDEYAYSFQNIQESRSFWLEAAGFKSTRYEIEVIERPGLVDMLIEVVPPAYTKSERQVISNRGDLTIPAGSKVSWTLTTSAATHSRVLFEKDTSLFSPVNADQFEIQKTIYKTTNYKIEIENEHGFNASKLDYNITAIEDQYPDISSTYIPDTLNFQFITIAGSIIDDYGFTSNTFFYKREKDRDFKAIGLGVNTNSNDQSFFFNWNLDSLNLKEGEFLEFYVAVSDNDQVNGAKTTESRRYQLQYPDSDTIDELIDDKTSSVQNSMKDTEDDVEELNDRLEEIEESLTIDQELNWQNEKLLREAIEDREGIEEQLEELKQKSNELRQTSEQFKNNSEEIKSKSEELQKLIEELKNDATKELYEKLKELLDQNSSADQIKQQLEKIQKNEQNLERELERTLELFKRLQMETKLENSLQMLDSLSAEQERLSENELNTENERKEQEEINEKFDEFQKDLDEVEKLNQELKRPEPLEDFEMEERQIDQKLEEIAKELEEQKEQEGSSDQDAENEEADSESGEGEQKEEKQGNESSEEQDSSEESQQEGNDQNNDQPQQKKKSTQGKQQKASQQMKQLKQKLSKMQSGMQMEVMQANLDQLRDILDNLVKLSFNQEDLMKEMRTVSQSDPRFLELSQDQLKLKDDAKVIQDSLLSLAEKVVQISSFITREVGNINENIDEALDFLKDRDRSRALSSQQFAMTSINNLALLLDNTMEQMQMSMSEAMGKGNPQDSKPQSLPDLQGMQEQLGKKIEELKESGKSGRELSEELARMAAEQEMIRRQLEELKEGMDGKPGGSESEDELEKAIRQMERNEVDLVNKRLTQQLINRQKQIMTRMLEAEKAQKEQDEEEEREAERPSVISREIPPEFEEYIKAKQKEKELLKSIPPELNPFYKKEVNDYFRRISSEEPK